MSLYEWFGLVWLNNVISGWVKLGRVGSVYIT